MNTDNRRGTLLRIPLIQERYGRSFLASLGIHGIVLLAILFGGYLLPTEPIVIGSGAGGGKGGDISTVGVVDELSGGAGMYKPSIVPRPEALKEKPLPKEESKAIPLPNTIDPKKKKPEPKEAAKNTKPIPESNRIPTAPEPGSGGAGGQSGGSGGGFGGGNGVSIGPGSGAFGDSWYARRVESRISDNWRRPPEGRRVEITISFYILRDGTVTNIQLEKSSGDPILDRSAMSAVEELKTNKLNPPPAEFRGRPILFMAQFIYPQNE